MTEFFYSMFIKWNLMWTLQAENTSVQTSHISRAPQAQGAQLVKNPPAMQENWVRFLGWEDPLEKGKATHSSILAWKTPWPVQAPEASGYHTEQYCPKSSGATHATHPRAVGPTMVPRSRKEGSRPRLLNCTAELLTRPHLTPCSQAPRESSDNRWEISRGRRTGRRLVHQ